jgi:hypothetical protein
MTIWNCRRLAGLDALNTTLAETRGEWFAAQVFLHAAPKTAHCRMWLLE